MASTLSKIRSSALARHADLAAGAPALWLLGALRRKRPVPQHLARIGLMLFETIGDTLLAASLIASLRAGRPGLEVVVFASRGNAGVLPLIAGIDRVVEVPLTQPRAALAAIRSVPVDAMIDIGQWPRWYALLCALSRTRLAVGFATPGQARHFAYDVAVPHRSDVHELENFQRLLAPFPWAAPLSPQHALKPVGEPPAAVSALARYVVIHPWASGFNAQAREWPHERWVALIQRIADGGRTVLIAGGPADRARADVLANDCGALPVRSIAGSFTFTELAAILKRADAVVSVNTGIMHLAALVGTPLVALHGPTSRRRWGPLGSRSIALAPPPGVRAEFLNLGFEYPPGAEGGMAHITVDQVCAALSSLLAEPPATHEAAA
jgi:heptosyltransferase III